MIIVKAYIKLYEKGRKTPFKTGYKPLFNFIEEMKTSGKIDLINKSEFFPGEEGEVKINFLNKNYLGNDFDVGKKFTFGEGGIALGEGVIICISSNQ